MWYEKALLKSLSTINAELYLRPVLLEKSYGQEVPSLLVFQEMAYCKKKKKKKNLSPYDLEKILTDGLLVYLWQS